MKPTGATGILYYYIKKSMFYSYPHKYPLKQNRLPIVVCVQVAFWLFVLGNFETEAQNLAMKP